MTAAGASQLDDRAAYREAVRAWLDANATPITDHDPWAVNFHSTDDEAQAYFDAGVAWQQKLYAGGYAAITVPTEYGGQGGEQWQEQIVSQESNRYQENAGFVRATIAMLGPTLLHHGTEEQKRTIVPRLYSADLTFCQLFSEPGAGSDLATLGTTAVRDGDEFVLNGQKVWNSAAQYCDWGFILTRTDPDQPKHRGITFMLVDMASPGIEVRPLIQMTGARHFNEVFLTDVRVPAHHVVGEVNAGWGPARTVLGNESAFIGRGDGPSSFDKVRLLAEAFDAIEQADVRQQLAELYTRERLQSMLGQRMVAAMRRGDQSAIDGSLIKVFATQTRIELSNLAMQIAGMHGVTDTGPMSRWVQAETGLRYSLSIGGGTTEVQKNNMAERTLGLPRDQRPDKNLPWRDIPR